MFSRVDTRPECDSQPPSHVAVAIVLNAKASSLKTGVSLFLRIVWWRCALYRVQFESLLLIIIFSLSNRIALFLISTRDVLSPVVCDCLWCSTQWSLHSPCFLTAIIPVCIMSKHHNSCSVWHSLWSLHSPIFVAFDSRRTHVYNVENTPSPVVLDSL